MERQNSNLVQFHSQFPPRRSDQLDKGVGIQIPQGSRTQVDKASESLSCCSNNLQQEIFLGIEKNQLSKRDSLSSPGWQVIGT